MAEVNEVRLPDIGDFTDVPVVEILVSVGDRVDAEDPLLTVESDKATMDVPAPFAGTVAELKVAVGETISQGDLLVMLEPAGEPPAQTGDAESKGAEAEEAEGGEAETVVRGSESDETAAEPGPRSSDAVYASPSVRRAARERGVDLTSIRGSGPRGRILPEDVASAGHGGPREGGTERVPLSRIRQIGGARLARNWVEIPHVTHHEDADVTDLEDFRRELNAEQAAVKVTILALLLKATAASLARFPEFNSSLDGDELVLKQFVNLGFAADTADGLVVPVIHDVPAKGIIELAAALAELSGKARDGKLAPGEMSGATFTISSLGGIGGTGFTPIINAPEVAILGVSRTATRPVWDGDQFVPRLMLPLSLSYDHRVIDGAAAARFCVHLAGLLGDLRRALL